MDATRQGGSESAASGAPAPLLDLTVVVPTFNEAKNAPLVVERLERVLAGMAWEVVFVDDDSPDGTAGIVAAIAARDARVRLIRRIGRRGLATACVEGILSSVAPLVAVMDGDLQHDDEALPEMVRRLKAGNLEIVVGSRYVAGERTEGLATPLRKRISRFSGRVAGLVLHAELTDPMSGFFVMTRAAFDGVAHRLSQQGFKILLDIFASSTVPLRFAEVPVHFHARRHGESKLDSTAAWDFGVLILDKLVGRYLPVRFVSFAIIGGTGVLAHLATLWAVSSVGFDFIAAQTSAVAVAMTWNFILNNLVTYRDLRLKGPAFFRGLLSFYLIGAVGALANIGIAQMIFNQGRGFWLAGLAGALIGVVWNFTMSSIFTWRTAR